MSATVRQSWHLGTDWHNSPHEIFCHPNCDGWTSLYFRETFLYPGLEQQQLEGDPFLQAFDVGPGNCIPSKYWSLHCYRQGAQSHVSGTQPGQYCTARKDQIYEHAHWPRSGQGEAIDVQYREWTIRDRLKITLFSM